MGLDGVHIVDIFLKDVRVPRRNILGTPGKGFGILLRWIATERIQQAAFMTGIGQAALDECIKYVKERKAGAKTMSYMQGIQWMLAEMKVKVDACRLMTRRAASVQDEGKPFEILSSELKIFVVPMIQEVTRMAVQIHGAYGYAKEYKVERLFRNAAHAGVVATSLEINKSIAGSALIR
jgi:butyryl-CoA dehydrogenase